MIFKNIFEKDENVYLASYPRSGNTWIRVLLANLYFNNPNLNSLIDLQSYIPDIHFDNGSVKRSLKIHNKFKIIKTHNLYNLKNKNKTIYIYRNPVDVAWSYYNFLNDTKQLESDNLEKFVDNFLSGNILFGGWEDHVKSWVYKENVIVISYEEFVKSTIEKLILINNFLGLEYSESVIKNAINSSTPEVVKKVTDDEVFYGANKPNFVTSPLTSDKEKKESFKNKYLPRLINEIKTYDFVNKKLSVPLYEKYT